jgi:hypothetical protein
MPLVSLQLKSNQFLRMPSTVRIINSFDVRDIGHIFTFFVMFLAAALHLAGVLANVSQTLGRRSL